MLDFKIYYEPVGFETMERLFGRRVALRLARCGCHTVEDVKEYIVEYPYCKYHGKPIEGFMYKTHWRGIGKETYKRIENLLNEES